MFDINDTLFEYSENEMKKLKAICDKLAKKTGYTNGSVVVEGKTIPGERSEMIEFYSIANYVLLKSCYSFDESKGINFQAYLISNLKRRLNTMIRDENVGKRIPKSETVSFDEDNGEKHPLTETVTDGKTIESTLFEEEKHEGRVDEFMSKLSNKQKKIMEMLLNKDTKSEIMNELNMSNKEYDSHLNRIKRLSMMLN